LFGEWIVPRCKSAEIGCLKGGVGESWNKRERARRINVGLYLFDGETRLFFTQGDRSVLYTYIYSLRSFSLRFVQDVNPLRMKVLNNIIFGESDEKGPIPGVQACGIGLETGLVIQNIEPDSYVKVYSWKQWF